MIVDALSLLALLGSGVTAGVLFAVALSVLPALQAMPAERYVYAHQLIGKHWDPVMPIIVLSSAVADVALALVAPPPMSYVDAAAGVLLAGVSVVSHFCNVPLNRTVKGLDPERIPPDWRDPRPVWRRWHLLRTTLALAALTANAAAALMT